MRSAAKVVFALACVNIACSGVDAGDAGTPTADAGPPGKLEVGTGVVEFESLEDHGPAELVPGPQSGGRYEGHHVWISLRLTGASPEELSTYGVTIFGADGSVAAEFERDAARAPFELDDAGRWALTGLAPRLADCCLIEGRAFSVRGEVSFHAGGRLTATSAGLAGACSVECP